MRRRPFKSTRPGMLKRREGEFTRLNYMEFVRRFRALWSDKTLAIRPQTYRALFKKWIGMREPWIKIISAPAQEVKGTASEKGEEEI